MLSIPRTTRVFLATVPTDMRKGFDGLHALVETVIEEDPFAGHLFVFRNQRRDRIKLLWWDRDGWSIFYKRLEKGRYEFPTDRIEQASCEIRAEELMLLLEGIDLKSVKRHPRYERPSVMAGQATRSSL
jgi:transposase